MHIIFYYLEKYNAKRNWLKLNVWNVQMNKFKFSSETHIFNSVSFQPRLKLHAAFPFLIWYRARLLMFNFVQFNRDRDRFARQLALFYKTWHHMDVPSVMVSVYWLQITRTYGEIMHPVMRLARKISHSNVTRLYRELHERPYIINTDLRSGGLWRDCIEH